MLGRGALIPEQTLSANPDYENEHTNSVSRICHADAELVNIRKVFSDDKNEGSRRKRLRGEPRKTPLSFVVTAKRNRNNATIECCLSTCPATHRVFQDYWQQLPKQATAKLTLALFSSELDFELGGFQKKTLEFKENELRLSETVDGFNFAVWNDIDHPILVSLSVTVSRKDKRVELTGEKEHARVMCEKIWQNMEYADAKLEASNGVEFPCHKVFLSAQSSFFQRMFASGMRESVSGRVALPDVSENVVRAMLSFIYCGNLADIRINCETALELLIAGDQYEIPRLETAIRDFLNLQTPEWFSTSVAVDLWQFANKKTSNENNVSYRCLQEKAVEVLRSKPKREIKECPAVTKMLENPHAGILEFCVYLLKNGSSESSVARESNNEQRQPPVYSIDSDPDLEDSSVDD